MAGTIELTHTHNKSDRKFYFYEGETNVKGGVISLPINRPEWIRRAFIMGFRIGPDGKEVSQANIDAMIAKERDSLKEQNATEESPDSGGLTSTGNRVRKSTPRSRKSPTK